MKTLTFFILIIFLFGCCGPGNNKFKAMPQDERLFFDRFLSHYSFEKKYVFKDVSSNENDTLVVLERKITTLKGGCGVNNRETYEATLKFKHFNFDTSASSNTLKMTLGNFLIRENESEKFFEPRYIYTVRTCLSTDTYFDSNLGRNVSCDSLFIFLENNSLLFVKDSGLVSVENKRLNRKITLAK